MLSDLACTVDEAEKLVKHAASLVTNIKMLSDEFDGNGELVCQPELERWENEGGR